MKVGKSYIVYLSFIDMVKKGKSAIVFAQDYVVIDRKSYDDLVFSKFSGQDVYLTKKTND